MVYDISPPIDKNTAVWPGDIPYENIVNIDMKNGAHITVSHIKTTLHIGAHADAPSHYTCLGKTIDEVALDHYIGPCQVIHIKNLLEPFTITLNHIIHVKIQAPRVLFKTGTFPIASQWNNEFAHICPEVIDELHRQNVKLIGIDTPSVDAFNSKNLKTHNKMAEHEILNLEGLDLSNVPEKIFELIALPLKLVGADASPVRAILRDLSEKS